VKLLPKVLVPKKSIAGTDDSLGRGPDIALSTAVFLVIGLAIDSATHTRPLFTIILVVLSLVGNFARMWYVYDDRMKLLEHERQQRSISHQGRDSEASSVNS
jgi:F0F1-type ATP synthase assembly protein I